MDYEERVKELEDELPKKIGDRLLTKLKAEEPSKKKVEEVIENVKRNYRSSKYEPGEAIGVVAAQSISEPATQMCTSYDEKVILKHNGRIWIKKIGKFVDKIMEKGFDKQGKYEIVEVPEDEDIEVLALDGDEKLKWSSVSTLNRSKSPSTLLEIKTASGRQITATDFHSFVTRKSNRIVPISGKDLEVGDRIPVMSFLPENCVETISLEEHSEEISPNVDVTKTGERLKTTSKSKSIPASLPLDKLTGFFFGAYLAEGSATRSQVNIFNSDEEYISRLQDFADQAGIEYSFTEEEGEFGAAGRFTINSSLFARFVKRFCGTGSAEKEVPDFAYSAREDFVAGLLKGYFDGDGNVTVPGKMIRVSSNSKNLIDGICTLLNRFGIFSYKTQDNKKQHGLIVPYKYAGIFREKIGSSINSKRRRIKSLSQLAKEFWTEKSQDFTDMISGFGDLLYKTARKLGYPTRYVNNFTKRQRIGRGTLSRYIDLFSWIAEEIDVDISDELSMMKQMVNSDVVWDRITKIERIESKHPYVYDLTVPDLHTFTTFEGVVTHNTMRTYHTAGAAQGVEITQGLPRLIEIVDARKTLDTPSMDVYIKDDYQEQEKAKEIANKIKETKLKDLVEEDRIDLLNLVLEMELNERSLEETNLDLEDIVNQVNKGRRKYEAELGEDDTLKIVPKKDDISVRDLQKMKNKVMDKHLKGIKNVSQAVVMEEGGEWKIQTLGINLKKVLKIEGVDPTRTVSSDPREMEKVFGIEACRDSIVKESYDIIVQQQGLPVDIRHMLLMADMMTVDGEIKAIGRYGVAGEKGSVLARASFEVTVRHLTEAAINGETDELNSTVENVLINQTVPVGTGMYEITYNPESEE
ncbi:hypothetical protein AKJ51_03900 [candidate division MSBL1 archaeon SCGC-AAA382A20]|uniref:DNA-directed RNA polymerase n=1 Tax=candidate division MSBL1 archaeon SCGC-AAA382A20 TaxID=1698280 RepID=A0A133VIN8_9EURY|nr:hypothetical protein AKJ51_03900 [candidate division MSBL1 archaeon SCGC-AAA382A20]